jgi:WD40 repeat protein
MPETTSTQTSKPELKTEQLKVLKLPTAVLSLEVSADAKHCYAACMDGGVYEVDAETGTIELLQKHDSFASGVALLAGEKQQIISAGYDGMIKWFSLEEKKPIRTVKAHDFWSWQLALAPNNRFGASVTGQYLAGGLKYEPLPEREPSVKIFDAETGQELWQFAHLPPVQSVAFSADSRFVAAGNLMGDIKVWELSSGKQVAEWNSAAFTMWGITKSHCYIGGIYSLLFMPGSNELLACGMGPIRDPMAGNGKQTWQRFNWRDNNPPKKMDEIHEGESGNGHPESLVIHPSGKYFVMAGRLAQGKWNTGFFDSTSGALIHSIDAKNRITKAVFNPSGDRLYLAGATSQEKKKDGKFQDFGRITVYSVAMGSEKIAQL